jgi:hypothetical protein
MRSLSLNHWKNNPFPGQRQNRVIRLVLLLLVRKLAPTAPWPDWSFGHESLLFSGRAFRPGYNFLSEWRDYVFVLIENRCLIYYLIRILPSGLESHVISVDWSIRSLFQCDCLAFWDFLKKWIDWGLTSLPKFRDPFRPEAKTGRTIELFNFCDIEESTAMLPIASQKILTSKSRHTLYLTSWDPYCSVKHFKEESQSIHKSGF